MHKVTQEFLMAVNDRRNYYMGDHCVTEKSLCQSRHFVDEALKRSLN